MNIMYHDVHAEVDIIRHMCENAYIVRISPTVQSGLTPVDAQCVALDYDTHEPGGFSLSYRRFEDDDPIGAVLTVSLEDIDTLEVY